MNIYLFEKITTDTATRIGEELNAANGDDVTLFISSGGGDVFSALAISHALKNYSGKVEIRVSSLCASAATLVLCCGRHVAAGYALFCLHSPTVLLQDAYSKDDLATIQTTLEKITETIRQTYASRLKKPVDWESGEVWLTAQEALDLGLIDEIEELKVMNILEKKYQASVRAAELGRINKLVAMKNDNPAVNALIDVALKQGQSAEDVKCYIDALKGIKPPAAQITDIIRDNMSSGAGGVMAQAVQTEAEKKLAIRNKVADFANGLI